MSSQSFSFLSRHKGDSSFGVYYIGLHRIDDVVKYTANPIVHIILLRIDCTEEDILSSCRECIGSHLGNVDVQYIPASLSTINADKTIVSSVIQQPSMEICWLMSSYSSYNIIV